MWWESGVWYSPSRYGGDGDNFPVYHMQTPFGQIKSNDDCFHHTAVGKAERALSLREKNKQ